MNKYFLPIYHSQLKPWIKFWLLKRLKPSAPVTLKAVTISEGTLTKVDKSKALSIKEYYGNTVQNGTPTPETPIEIQTISGDNTFNINSVNYRLDLGGDNKLPQDKYIASTEVNGITYTNNGDGTFSLSGTASANTTIRIIPVGDLSLKTSQAYYLYSSQAYNSTSFNMSIVLNDSGTNRYLTANGTLTTPSSFTQARLQFYIASGNTVNVQNIKLMLVEGNTAPSRYSPYVSNPIELCKIGNYKDSIFKAEEGNAKYDSLDSTTKASLTYGNWYIEKNIGKKVFVGDDSENWYYSAESKGFSIAPSFFADRKRTAYMGYCNYFSVNTNSTTWTALNYCGWNTSGTFWFKDNGYMATSKADLLTYLSTHNLIVYYVLSTPTYEIITNENLIQQLNALYEFYVGLSTVSISNNSEIPLEVLLEYYGR